jgi:hypothetical protein
MLALFFVVVNVLFWIGIVLLQRWEFRAGRIPARRKWNPEHPDGSFLYLQDWYSGSFGDLLGLSCLAWAFGANLKYWTTGLLLSAFVMSLAITISLHYFWKRGRPNSGYPARGEISISGKAHLLYSFIHISIALSLFFGILSGDAGTTILIPTLCGVVLYGISLLCDVHMGKFSRRSLF